MKVVRTSLITIAIIVAVTLAILLFLWFNQPEAEKKERIEAIPVVEVVTVKKANVAIPLASEGMVMTRRETVLSAQVGGRLVEVHPMFEVGALFKKGTVIALVDPIDYEVAVAQARSALTSAELELVREQARGEQAVRDWQKIGGGEKASELVLRVPYLKTAEAQVLAARAQLELALKNLERTKITAPFNCRVRRASLNLGSTVAPGSQVGMIYDPESLMVRLPFSLDDYAMLPENPEIELFAEIGQQRYQWSGRLLRDSGEIDQMTVSANLFVEVLANEEAPERFRLPAPGQFLKAKLSGVTLPDVVSIPRAALRGRDQVWIVNAEGKLEFRTLTISQRTEDFVFAVEGVSDGDRVVETKLQLPVPGMALTIAETPDQD